MSVKSVLAGFPALLLSVVLLWTALTGAFTFVLPRWASGSGGIGAVSVGIPVAAVAVPVGAIFALGFYWEFRRACRG
jgi:hypothetical protein